MIQCLLRRISSKWGAAAQNCASFSPLQDGASFSCATSPFYLFISSFSSPHCHSAVVNFGHRYHPCRSILFHSYFLDFFHLEDFSDQLFVILIRFFFFCNRLLLYCSFATMPNEMLATSPLSLDTAEPRRF